MPELPDVEGFRKVLASCGQGRRIARVDVADPGVLRGVSVRRLRQEMEGRTFTEPSRHGKWLIARTDGGPALMLHFGMTGELLCCPPAEPRHPYDRVLLDLSGGRGLRYRDQRKPQGLRLAGSEAEIDRILDGQGPDALAPRPRAAPPDGPPARPRPRRRSGARAPRSGRTQRPAR